MATSRTFDWELRERFSRWVTYYRGKLRYRYPTDISFAEAWGVSPAQLSRVLNEPRRSLGIETVVRFSRAFKAPLEMLTEVDPPKFAAVDQAKADLAR